VLGEGGSNSRNPSRRRPFDLPGALDGIRVVDFCWMIAGPLGTRMLAHFGAEVLRVEAGRRAYPDNFPAGQDDPSLGAFQNILNTGKKSITVDPRTECVVARIRAPPSPTRAGRRQS
jgi:crotonobetainyl-CoA:carnitine CoA-transferase CaiB-like acyl-CoA transferase